MTTRDPSTFVADRAEREISGPPAPTMPSPVTGGSGILSDLQFGGATPAAPDHNPAFAADREALYANARVLYWGSGGDDPFADSMLAPLVDYADQLTREDPALRQALLENADNLAALGDDEILNLVRSGGVTPLDDIFNSLADTAWEAGADQLFVRQLQERNQASEELFTGLKLGFDTPPEGFEAFGGFSLENATGWAMDDAGNLAVSFGARQTKGTALTGTAPVSDELTVLARLDPSIKIESQLDLLGAIRKAAVDGELRLVDGTLVPPAQVEEATKPLIDLGRNVRGTRWEPVVEGLAQAIKASGGIFNTVDIIRDSFAQSETPLLDELANGRTLRQMEAVEQQLGTVQHPRGFIVASLAVSLADEVRSAGQSLSNSEAMGIVREAMSDDEIDGLAEDYLNMTRSQFLSEVEKSAEELTPGEAIAGAFGEAFDPTQKALEVWSDISQQVGVQVYDWVWDVEQGWMQVATGDIEQGFEHFRNAYSDPADFDLSPAGWFAKQGFAREYDDEGNFIDNTSGGQAINLFTEFWADPTNLLGIGVSGGAARRLSRQAVTDARFADVFTSLPEVRRLVDDVASPDATRALAAAFDVDGADTAVWKLIDQALNPNSSREAVETAMKDLLPSMPGDGNFLGRGGFTRSRTNSIGFASQLDKIRNMDIAGVSRILDSDTGRKLTDWFVNASTERTISTLDPYEGVKRLVATLYHSDNDGMVRWARELADVGRSGGNLSDARLGELAARVEDLKRGIDDLTAQARLAGPSPQALQDALQQTTEQLRLTDEGSEAFTRLSDQAASLQRQIDVGTPHADLAARRAELDSEITAINRLRNKDTLADTHQAINDLVYRIYDDWAEKINQAHRAAGFDEDLIPVVTGRGNARYNGLAPGVRVRDWSNVSLTGHSPDFTRPEEVSRLAGLADDPVIAAKASAVGMFNAQSQIPLPISPSEMLMAFGLAGKREAADLIRKTAGRTLAKQLGAQWRSLWSALVLMNPETAIRTGLDEALGRFPLVTGDLIGTGQAIIASVPGVGKWADNWITSSYVRAGTRGSGSSAAWDLIEQTGEWATRKGKWSQEARAHVERFVNGGLVEDDVFQNFARALDDPEIEWVRDAAFAGGQRPVSAPEAFKAWWESQGVFNVRSSVIDLGDRKIRKINNADDAFAVMWDVWNGWLDNMVRPDKHGQVAGRILDAATGKAGALDVDKDAAILNYITKVQAQVPSRNDFLFGGINVPNPMARGWDFFFATPSHRRQGVIMQRLMDRNLGMLTEAHSKNGKFIVTPEALVERFGMDPAEAAWAVRQGAENPIVRNLLQDQGVTTMANLERVAYNAARREALDMMYQLSATTRAGKAVDNPLIAPFFRAQTDFLGWWEDYLTRPLTLRLGPNARQALASHPMLQNIVQGSGKIPGIESMPGIVNAGVRGYRNLAHFYGAFGGTSGDDQTWLERAVDRITFLPGPWSDDWITKVAPGPGLLTGGALDAAFDDEGTAQAFIDQLWPSIGWNQNAGLAELAFPNPTRGIRNFAASQIKAAASLLGYPPDTEITDDSSFLTWFVGILESGREPVGVSDYESMLWSKWLAENGGSVRPGSDEWLQAKDQIALEARAAAFSWTQGEGGKDLLAYAVPFYYSVVDPDLYATDRLSLESFSGILEDDTVLDTLLQLDADRKAAGLNPIFEANLLYDDEAGGPADNFEDSRLAQAWQRWREGTASKDDRQFLGDSLSDLFYNTLDDIEVWEGYGFSYRDFVVATNPQAGMALTSGLAPSDREPQSAEGLRFWRGGTDANGNYQQPHVSEDGTTLINIPPGPAGDQLRRNALENGWVRERSFDERAADAHNAYLSARSKIIGMMWTMETSRDWSADSSRELRDGQRVSGVKSSIRDKTFTVSDNVRFWADQLGLSVPGETMTYQTYRELLEGWREQNSPAPFVFEEMLGRTPGEAMKADEWGRQQIQDIEDAFSVLGSHDITSFSDWPDEAKADVRARFSEAFNRGLFTREEYDRNWASYFGELDFQPPTPPPVSDLQMSVQARPNQITVTDGDTVNLHFEDGTVPVRIVGLLAPDEGQEGYDEATDNLRKLIEGADEVTFGIFDPETFGTYQLQGPGRRRALMWIYVDGVPIWDESIFTADTPTGSRGDPRVTDLQAIYESGR